MNEAAERARAVFVDLHQQAGLVGRGLEVRIRTCCEHGCETLLTVRRLRGAQSLPDPKGTELEGQRVEWLHAHGDIVSMRRDEPAGSHVESKHLEGALQRIDVPNTRLRIVAYVGQTVIGEEATDDE